MAAGAGPWFAALLVDGSNERAHFVGHTQPCVLPDSGWSIASQVGPFDVWSDCAIFVAQWQAIGGERGHELYDYHARMRRLCFITAATTSKTPSAKRRRKQIGEIKAVCIKPKKQYK